MRIIETKAYLYNELSDTAKQKARDWWYTYGFEYFPDCVIEYTQQMAAILGIADCKVFYSGFWSQGDGACINGRYSYNKGALKRIKEYTPTDTVLHGIAKRLQDAQSKVFYGTTCKITHSGGYCHANSMDYDFNNDTIENTNESNIIIRECFYDFANWIYKQLNDEYDYQTSDNEVEETLITNEYEFTEEGKPI
jgi:hypothetical protein